MVTRQRLKGFNAYTGFGRALYLLPALVLTTLAGCATQPTADRQSLSESARGCISVTRIMNTDVIDESTLVFEMDNGEIYRNSLPQRCGGLSNRDAFMYRIPTTQLCRSDIITVLQRSGPAGGTGFTPINSCALGSFEQVSEGDLEMPEATE